MIYAIRLCVVALLLTGCNSQPPDQTVFDDQLETMDRARAVEDTLNDRASDIARRLEDDNGNEDPPQ